ncbi:MAG TPA: dihydrofolate reductase family protein [Allosphingosinicella sp.]|nr:dihydrofolate reductase family protein [Allosphingosinicella sp.]
MTRKVTFGGAVSLDMYFAGPGEAMDWLRWSDEAAAVSAASWKGVDTMLMGRRTFDFAMREGGGLRVGPRIRTFVFSRTLSEVPEGAQLVGGDAADFVRRLKAEPGGDIIVMGGGELGSALIDAGLVDEIGLNVHPVLLGGGIPAFRPMARRVEVELVEARPLAKGCVLLRYRAGGGSDLPPGEDEPVTP